MDFERKQFSATVTGTEDKKGIVEAIVSVFGNTDVANEVVLPGAFEKSLLTRLPKGVWAHDWHTPVAKTLEAREVRAGEKSKIGGLYIKGQFNLETQRGREAFSDIDFGIIDEFSIGYRVVKDSLNTDTGIRELIEVELFEWSPVLIGMNPATELLKVKSSVPATFAFQADNTLAVIGDFRDRAVALAGLRAKEGRVISSANRTRISAAVEAIRGMQGLADDLDALLALADPEKEKSVTSSEARKIYASYLRTNK